MAEHWKPEGESTVIPYLVVDDIKAELDFVEKVLGAKRTLTLDMPGGAIAHAEVNLGGSKIMLGSAGGPWKPFPAMLCVYVPDVDATYQKAVAAGAEPEQPVEDQYYGDRSGAVRTANGVRWSIHTHKETLSEEETKRRMMEKYGNGGGGGGGDGCEGGGEG